jgi:ribosomal protein L37AE/L43A
LSTTSKMGRQEVIDSMNRQLEELKVLEKGLMPSHAGWDGELQAMEARSQMLKGEVANLRARIAQLESEEQMIQAGIAVRRKYLALVEKTVKELFANIGAEIALLNKKLEELSAEASAAQPGPSAVQQTPPAQRPDLRTEETIPQTVPPVEQKEGGEQKVEIKGEPVPADSKFQRTCPQCGGQLNLLELENMWQCFTCGHEEPSTGAVPGTDPSLFSARRSASRSPEVERSKKGSTSSGEKPTKKKDCPVCSKKMYWYPDTKAWRCPSCQYERRI